MALVKCKECRKSVAASAKVCPHCGVSTPNQSTALASVIIKLVIAGLLGISVYSCMRSTNESTEVAGRVDNGQAGALVLCQEAISQVAANPSSAKVPYAKDYGSRGEHYFAWAKGSGLTMMNGYGADVDASASCTTTSDGRTITSLTVDGKTYR